MNPSTLIDVVGLCGALVALLGAIRPRVHDRLPAWLVAGLVCLAFGASLSLGAFEDRRTRQIADRAIDVLHAGDATPDEIHAALGDVAIGEIMRALASARDRGLIDDRLVELLEPGGSYVTTRVYSAAD